MFVRIQDLFPRELNRHGIAKAATASSICDHAKKILSEIFPEEAQEFINAKSFKDGTLNIGVPDGGWAEVVLSRKEELIKAMNAKFGDEVIKKLVAKVTVEEENM